MGEVDNISKIWIEAKDLSIVSYRLIEDRFLMFYTTMYRSPNGELRIRNEEEYLKVFLDEKR